MPLSYREVKDIYDSLPRNESIEEFSARMNALTGSSLYSSGLQDNWIKRTSVGLDRLLEATGLPDLLGEVGGAVGSLVDNEEAGERIGRSLPRGAVNFLPAMIPGVGWAGKLATGLLGGSDVYTQSGSPAAGIVGGGISALMPGVANLAERAVLRRLGVKPLEGTITTKAGPEFIREYLPQNLGQGAAAFAGGELAASVFSEFGNMASAAVDPNTEYHFSPTEAALDMTLGQIPFAALAGINQGVRSGFGGQATRAREAALQKNIVETNLALQRKDVEEQLKNQNPVERFPKVEIKEPNLTVLADTNRRLSELYQQQKQAANNPNSVDADDAAARTDEIAQLLRSAHENGYDGSGVAGLKQTNTTTHQPMVAKEVFRNKQGTYRIVELEDGRRVGHSIISSTPQPKDIGRNEWKEYSIPNGFYTEVVNRPQFDPAARRQAKQRVVDPKQPELPNQLEPLDVDEWFDSTKELADAEKKLQEVKTVAEFQAGVQHLNLVRGLNDLPELTDKQLEQRRQVANLDSLEKAALAEAKKTQRILQARRDAIAKHVARIEGVSEVTPSGATMGTEKNMLMQWGREDASTQAAMDKVDEWLEEASVNSTKEFEQWQRSAQTVDRTSLPIERVRTSIMVRLLQLGDVDFKPTLTKAEQEAFSDALAEEGLRPITNEAIADFLSRPHVVKMLGQVNAKFQPQAVLRAPSLGWVPAGDGFVWGMSGYNPITKKLGDRNTEQPIPVGAFRNLAGQGQPISEGELEMMKLTVPEAFVGDKVNVQALYQGLLTKGPVIEVKTLGGGEANASREERARIQHELETLGYRPDPDSLQGEITVTRISDGELMEYSELPQEVTRLLDTYAGTFEVTDTTEFGDVGGTRYAFVAPKNSAQMPGYVEGLVRVPTGELELTADEVAAGYKKPLKKAPQYSGPHFGTEDTNVLAFFRGYEETLPDGRKAFHVIEVQSDWGQARRAADDFKVYQNERLGGWVVESGNRRGMVGPFKTEAEAKQKVQEVIEERTKGHPLLPGYETLALKAAIAHAKSIGADALILSDAETAMMSEGHDRVSPHPIEGQALTEADALRNIEEQGGINPKITPVELTIDGEKKTVYRYRATRDKNPEPSQAAGMRLHYDRILPSVAEKLTGGKGESVELGTHTKALGEHYFEDAEVEGLNPLTFQSEGNNRNRILSGSPVFRNPDGSPKSSITGRLYSLANLPAFQNQGGFTLGQSNRAPYTPFVPTAPADVELFTQLAPQRGVLGSVEWVAKTATDPLYSALARDMIRLYPDVLQRIQVEYSAERIGEQFVHDQTKNYRGKVILTDYFFSVDPDFQHYTILHEAMHAVTSQELRNPAKQAAINKLHNLRVELAGKLPKDVRTVFDQALESNFIVQYQMGLISLDQLHPDFKTARLLYGLLDLDEFVAQGMTDSVVREFMQNQRGTKAGKSWIQRFKEFFAELVGLPSVKGTAFDDFLMHVDELTNEVNSVVKFREFADHYLSRKGITGEQLNTKSRMAEGILSNIRHFDEHPDDLVTAVSRYEDLMGTPLARAQNILDNSILQEDLPFQGFSAVMSDMGYDATRQGLDSFIKDVMAGDVDWKTAFELMPSTASRYVFEKVNAIHDVLDTIRAATVKELTGFTNIKDPKRVSKHASSIQKRIDQFLSGEKMLDEAVAAIQGVMAIDPKGFFATNQSVEQLSRVPSAEAFLNTSKIQQGWIKRTLGKLERFFKPISQYDDLEFREATAKGWQLPSNTRKMLMEATKVYGIDLASSQFTTESVQKAVKAMSDPKVQKAYDGWIYENQLNGKETGSTTILPSNDPRVAKHLAGLTPEQRQQTAEFLNKHSAANMIMSAQVLEKMSQIAVIDGARVLGVHNKGKVADNVKLSEVLWQAMHLDPSDPALLAAMQNQIAMVQGKMTPEAFNDLLGLLQRQKESRDIYKKHFDENPAWSSAQRFGKYIAKFFRNGRPIVLGVNNKKEALQLAKGAPLVEFRERKQTDDDNPYVGTDKQEVIDRLNELKQNNLDLFRKLGFEQEFIDTYDRTSEATQFAREVAGQTGAELEGIPERGLTRGAQELPWLSNHFSWMGMTAAKWSRKLFRHQMDAYLGQAEIAENQQMQSDLRQHRDNILQADPETIQNVNSFVRTWFMGYNPANVIINAAQPFTTHVAELTNLTNSVSGSYKRVKSALAEVAGRKWGNAEWSSPEIKRLMEDAVHDGEVGLSQYDEDRTVQEAAQVNFKRAADANRPKTLGQYLGSMFGAYSTWGMALFRHGEMINNQAALIASFKLFREQGMTYEQARDRAYQFNHTVNFGGGKSNRPIGLFSGKGDVLRGAAMLASSMQSYVLGTTFQIIRHIKRGYFSGGKLTPAEKWGARKAGVQMLATQFAAAGLLGLPFAASAVALLDKSFPDLEVNKNLREWVQQLWAEDEENGHVMTDIAMTGLPSMLGWDLQSRLSMGNTLPGVSEVNGFQPENLLGPPANLIRQFLVGGQRVISGQGGADAFLPSAVKKLVNVLADDGKLKDYRDRPLPNSVITPGEAVGVALGFQPKRVSDYNAAQRVAMQSESVENRRKGLFRQELAEVAREGNFGIVRQRLLDAAAADKTMDVVSEARSVARAVEELEFPRDLRREGNAGRSKLLSTFSLDLTQPQEMARIQFRRQIEQRLGVPTSSSGDQEVFLAQLMDQLKVSNPTLSRRELRRLAETALRREKVASLVE